MSKNRDRRLWFVTDTLLESLRVALAARGIKIELESTPLDELKKAVADAPKLIGVCEAILDFPLLACRAGWPPIEQFQMLTKWPLCPPIGEQVTPGRDAIVFISEIDPDSLPAELDYCVLRYKE